MSEAAVVGVPDEKWDERPLATVVPKPEHKDSLTPQAIKDFIAEFVARGELSKWAIPDKIIMAPAIPKTSVGKIDKKTMRAQIAKQG